jgi:L-methionine (R)-S-oxide reductase
MHSLVACDSASASELVVPIIFDDRLFGVLDLDSPLPGRFDSDDVAGCESLVAILAPRLRFLPNSASIRPG